MGTGNSVLCARQKDPNAPGELLVAPCFLPNIFAGPYWVLTVGEDADGDYEWTIVSGGQPTVQYPDGCTTKKTGVSGSGSGSSHVTALPRIQLWKSCRRRHMSSGLPRRSSSRLNR